MYDVYLGGISEKTWREEFKKQISDDITIYDPFEDDYRRFSERQKSECVGEELTVLEEQCSIAVFYFYESVSCTSLIELGDATGRGKQVFVCTEGEMSGLSSIQRYCDFRGILYMNSLEDLITTIEEYMAQVELCAVEEEISI